MGGGVVRVSQIGRMGWRGASLVWGLSCESICVGCGWVCVCVSCVLGYGVRVYAGELLLVPTGEVVGGGVSQIGVVCAGSYSIFAGLVIG